ncbi:MAG TPA: adenine phosphoribosyltransferase [Longimicrobiaceae bacterium]
MSAAGGASPVGGLTAIYHPNLIPELHSRSKPEVQRWTQLVRPIADFPSPGVTFRDITPLVRDPDALSEVVDALAGQFRPGDIDAVAAIESRGFIFGAPLAFELEAGFIPIRKLGKLPAPTIRREYALEYGSGSLEMHRDALRPGDRILLVDDVLATGGTARAAVEMIEELGGHLVEVVFVIELLELGGRSRLPESCPVRALTEF